MANPHGVLIVYLSTFLLCMFALRSNAWFRADGYDIGLGKLCGNADGNTSKDFQREEDEICWVWKSALFLGEVSVSLQGIGVLSLLGTSWKFKKMAFFVTLLMAVFKVVTIVIVTIGYLKAIDNPTPLFGSLEISWGVLAWTTGVLIDIGLVLWQAISLWELSLGDNNVEQDYDDGTDDEDNYRYYHSTGGGSINNQDRNRKQFEQLYAWYSTGEPFYSRRLDNGFVAARSPRADFTSDDDIDSFISDDSQVDEDESDAYSYYRSRQGVHTQYGSI